MASLLIDQVIAELDEVVARAVVEKSRLGYFAALYRRVTIKVKEGIETPGFFDDPERMDRLDHTFARRYLDALAEWRGGERPTSGWRRAFTAAESWRPLILQQLVLGINVHINLDLGIAAARTSPGPALPGLAGDFDRINQILGSLIGLVESQLGELSPKLGWLFRLAGEDGTRAVEFSMNVARKEAWRFASELASFDEARQAPLIALRDRKTAKLAWKVLHPGPLIDLVNLAVRARETRDVERVLAVLSAPDPPVTTMARPAYAD